METALKMAEQTKPLDPPVYLFNLVVCYVGGRTSEALSEAVQLITSRFPCRLILVEAGLPTDAPRWEIAQPPKDQTLAPVTIRAGGPELERIPFTITAQLVADLPVHVLFSSNPQSDNTGILASILKVTSRLIFDSDSIPDIQRFRRYYQSSLHPLPIDVVDMNWTQTAGWRELFARVFHTPELIEKLKVANAIKIRFNTHPGKLLHPEIQALYLQGWLAHRLGWTLVEQACSKKAKLRYVSQQKTECVVELIPDSVKDDIEGSIVGIEVNFPENCTFSFDRLPNSAIISVHRTSAIQCELPYQLPFPSLKRGYRFFRDVFYRPTSDDYIEVLKAVEAMGWIST